MDLAAWISQGVLAPVIGGGALLLGTVLTLRAARVESLSRRAAARRAQWWAQAAWILDRATDSHDKRDFEAALHALSRGHLRNEHDEALIDSLTAAWPSAIQAYKLEARDNEVHDVE